jgi:hypothetical protein
MTLTRTWLTTSALVAVMSAQGLAQFNRPAPAPADHREGARRVPFAASLNLTIYSVFDGWPEYDIRCAGANMSQGVGAGASGLFGLVWARASHCLGSLEATPEGVSAFPFTEGRFELVDTRGRTVVGQYRGRLLETFNGHTSEWGPTGHWLVQGNACVSGGTRYAHIVDDCAAGRFAPMNGLVNFDTMDGKLHFDQTIGVAGK